MPPKALESAPLPRRDPLAEAEAEQRHERGDQPRLPGQHLGARRRWDSRVREEVGVPGSPSAVRVGVGVTLDTVDELVRLARIGAVPGRPEEAEDRVVPVHREEDLLLGPRQRSAIATLVERKTCFVLLVALLEGRTTEAVTAALGSKIVTLPEALRRSVTWDQGKEMAAHARFTSETDLPVFFCDPPSPWQRGGNENTIGLLRDYFPKRNGLQRPHAIRSRCRRRRAQHLSEADPRMANTRRDVRSGSRCRPDRMRPPPLTSIQ